MRLAVCAAMIAAIQAIETSEFVSAAPLLAPYAWLHQLLINICGYGSVLLPGYIAVKYINWSGYLQQPRGGIIFYVIQRCVHGVPVDFPTRDTKQSVNELGRRSLVRQCFLITFCSLGLLISYLLWGLLQERIMAVKYESVDGSSEHFGNSLFLEFMNRILALFVACALLVLRRQPMHTAPIHKYVYNALSNVMSSWCQYEALKYISFPVQVLAKAAKVIPVMLMGRFVSRQTYTLSEYFTAAMISGGLFMFVMSTENNSHTNSNVSHISTLSGLTLLAGYLAFDAFTSNWQSHLFRTHHMSSSQMMAGSNLFSVIFAGVSLVEQGGFHEALSFMARHPSFMFHIVILSITSAIGQLFIYYTIAEFGAVTFTIIMTVRQGFAILLSCIIYHHPLHFSGIVGIAICFTAIFIRTYRSHWLLASQKQHGPVLNRISVERHS